MFVMGFGAHAIALSHEILAYLCLPHVMRTFQVDSVVFANPRLQHLLVSLPFIVVRVSGEPPCNMAEEDADLAMFIGELEPVSSGEESEGEEDINPVNNDPDDDQAPHNDLLLPAQQAWQQAHVGEDPAGLHHPPAFLVPDGPLLPPAPAPVVHEPQVAVEVVVEEGLPQPPAQPLALAQANNEAQGDHYYALQQAADQHLAHVQHLQFHPPIQQDPHQDHPDLLQFHHADQPLHHAEQQDQPQHQGPHYPPAQYYGVPLGGNAAPSGTPWTLHLAEVPRWLFDDVSSIYHRNQDVPHFEVILGNPRDGSLAYSRTFYPLTGFARAIQALQDWLYASPETSGLVFTILRQPSGATPFTWADSSTLHRHPLQFAYLNEEVDHRFATHHFGQNFDALSLRQQRANFDAMPTMGTFQALLVAFLQGPVMYACRTFRQISTGLDRLESLPTESNDQTYTVFLLLNELLERQFHCFTQPNADSLPDDFVVSLKRAVRALMGQRHVLTYKIYLADIYLAPDRLSAIDEFFDAGLNKIRAFNLISGIQHLPDTQIEFLQQAARKDSLRDIRLMYAIALLHLRHQIDFLEVGDSITAGHCLATAADWARYTARDKDYFQQRPAAMAQLVSCHAEILVQQASLALRNKNGSMAVAFVTETFVLLRTFAFCLDLPHSLAWLVENGEAWEFRPRSLEAYFQRFCLPDAFLSLMSTFVRTQAFLFANHGALDFSNAVSLMRCCKAFLIHLASDELRNVCLIKHELFQLVLDLNYLHQLRDGQGVQSASRNLLAEFEFYSDLVHFSEAKMQRKLSLYKMIDYNLPAVLNNLRPWTNLSQLSNILTVLWVEYNLGTALSAEPYTGFAHKLLGFMVKRDIAASNLTDLFVNSISYLFALILDPHTFQSHIDLVPFGFLANVADRLVERLSDTFAVDDVTDSPFTYAKDYTIYRIYILVSSTRLLTHRQVSREMEYVRNRPEIDSHGIYDSTTHLHNPRKLQSLAARVFHTHTSYFRKYMYEMLSQPVAKEVIDGFSIHDIANQHT